MNLNDKISKYMTIDLICVEPDEKLIEVQDIFDRYNIHHLPVVLEGSLKGLVSKSDLLYFLKGLNHDSYQDTLNEIRLKNYKAGEIMTTELTVLKPSDSIDKAMDIFFENEIRAIPIVKNEELVGILTPYDMLIILKNEASTT